MVASAAAVVAALVLVPSSTAAAAASAPNCANIYFVGSRGSGELLTDGLTDKEKKGNAAEQKASPNYGLGKPLARLYKEWLKTIPLFVKTEVIYNPYEAANVNVLTPKISEVAGLLSPSPFNKANAIASYYYGDANHGVATFAASVKSGQGTLVQIVSNKAAECPTSKFVLAGYSQGAMATHRALDDLAEYSSTYRRIIGVFLVADGDRYATQANKYGSADPGATGIRAAFGKLIPLLDPQPSPVRSYNIVADICNRGDIVCDWSVPNAAASIPPIKRGIKIHEAYQNPTPKNDAIADAVSGMKRQIIGALNFPAISIYAYIPTKLIYQQQYDATLYADGGDGKYTFSVEGKLPPGLKQKGNLITGKPSVQFGNFPLTIKVTDGQGQRDFFDVTLKVGLK